MGLARLHAPLYQCQFLNPLLNAKPQKRRDATELREAFGARSLLPLWSYPTPYDGASKLGALHALRDTPSPVNASRLQNSRFRLLYSRNQV
jgi:hypothetical protein